MSQGMVASILGEFCLEVSTFTSTDRFNLYGGSNASLCGYGVSGTISGWRVFIRVLHGTVASILGEYCTVCSVLNEEAAVSG